jgi:hypothetical protein
MYAEKIFLDSGFRRLPNELERRFMDVLYVISTNGWDCPDSD